MRRALADVLAEREQAQRFEAWAAPKKGKDGKPRKRTPATGAAVVARAVAVMTEIRTAGEWNRAQPQHFVALYADLHRHVYGVEPIELEKEWLGAVSACRKLMKDEFAADPLKFMKFMQWVWGAEQKKAKTRDASNAFRIGWRLMFVGRGMVTDYRVAMVRSGKGTR